jgi:hypothetical protein
MKKWLASTLLFCTIGCTSGTAVHTKEPEAVATISLLSISPAPGSTLTEESVLVANLAYSIDGFRPGVDYYIAPLFASTSPVGSTFNARDRINDSPLVSTAEGRISLRYNVARELRSAQLARPIQLWFYVMERTGEHSTRVIGKTEVINFVAPPRR